MIGKKMMTYFLFAGLITGIFTGCMNNNDDKIISKNKISVRESVKKIFTSPYEGRWGHVAVSKTGRNEYRGTKVSIYVWDVRKAKDEEKNDKNRDEFFVKYGDVGYQNCGFKRINDKTVELTFRWQMIPNYNGKIIGVIDRNSDMHLITSVNSGDTKLRYLSDKDIVEAISKYRTQNGLENLVYNRMTDEEFSKIKNSVRLDIENSKYIADQKKSFEREGSILAVKFID